MGDFSKLNNIKGEYRTLEDNVIENFYIPLLSNCKTYYRAAGYFSSDLLMQITVGINRMYKNGGKMYLVCSPNLKKEDYEAIKKGYELKEVFSNRVMEDFSEPETNEEKDRFNLLAHLIANGYLDIKIAAVQNGTEFGIYHEKLGLMYDDLDNMIAFSGSINETYSGYSLNYESFDVFKSWESDEQYNKCLTKQFNIRNIWQNRDKHVITMDMPTVIKERILSYHNNARDYLDLDKKYIQKIKQIKEKKPFVETSFLYQYQKDAIERWKDNNYIGIFDMATGTGKTFTAGGAIIRLFNDKKRAFVIICCPYIHLVDQWIDEMAVFHITALRCYGSANYKDRLKRAVMKYQSGRSDFECIIVVNASFKTDYFQQTIEPIINEALLVVDEAHNFGSDELQKTLHKNYPYRLALSATFDRYMDDSGTAELYRFFGNKCIEYTLEMAIQNNVLTKYNYYPVLVPLTVKEYENYCELSDQISVQYSREKKNENGKIIKMSEKLKMLLLARSRLIAAAHNKVPYLRRQMDYYKDKDSILIYCGAVKYSEAEDGYDEEKQIKAVVRMLTKEFRMTATKFTAEEDAKERNNIKKGFAEKDIQAVVAIKCLDEGMNIPGIKTAFILASSSNPKEYIQRRGRVLRKSKDKQYAEIYDFVTIPFDIKGSKPSVISRYDQNLVKKELNRVYEFKKVASNGSECNDLIDNLKDFYELDTLSFEGEEDLL